jgi:hypothetical protein
MIYYDALCKQHVDGDDKEEWEDFNTLIPTHPNYAQNSKALFDAFWMEFKDDFDAGKYPADISPKKLIEAQKAAASPAASGRAASGPHPPPTAPPAMNMANAFSFGADSVGAAMGNMNITSPAAQTFTFGAPSRSVAEEPVEIYSEEEDEEEEEEEEEQNKEEVLQKVLKKSMAEEEEDEEEEQDEDDDGPYTGGVVKKALLPGAALNKKKK